MYANCCCFSISMGITCAKIGSGIWRNLNKAVVLLPLKRFTWHVTVGTVGVAGSTTCWGEITHFYLGL
jgi:hypothetical protein